MGTTHSLVISALEKEVIKTMYFGCTVQGGSPWWWGYCLPEEERSRGMMNGVRVGYDSLSINVLELFGTVWTAFAMIVIKKESPE